PIHLDKHVLSQILRVVGRARKSVADVIEPPVVALNNLLPRHRIACNAASDKTVDDLRVFQRALPGDLPDFRWRRRCETRHAPRLTSPNAYETPQAKVHQEPSKSLCGREL